MIDWTKNTLQFKDKIITAIRPDFIPEQAILSAKQFVKFIHDGDVDCFCIQLKKSEITHVESVTLD